MKLYSFIFLIISPLIGHTQVYLDPEPIKEYVFEDYIKQDSMFSYNPKVYRYVEYNADVVNLKYIFDLFANITHVNPNTSNVTLNIYKPGKKMAKPFSFINVFLDNTFIIPDSWYDYYQNCFDEFFRGLQMTAITSKVSNKKHLSYLDNERNVVVNVYFFYDNDKNYIQILVNEKDQQFENQLNVENLAKK